MVEARRRSCGRGILITSRSTVCLLCISTISRHSGVSVVLIRLVDWARVQVIVVVNVIVIVVIVGLERVVALQLVAETHCWIDFWRR